MSRDECEAETAHSARNPKCRHDTYVAPFGERDLSLKFAGETLIDVTLTSFKEA